MGKVVYGFPAIGKTTLCKSYAQGKVRLLDLESSNYEYILTQTDKKLSVENRKGTLRIQNPEWPNNYLVAIIKSLKKYDYVFVAHAGIVLCAANNIPYWRIFPNYECKSEYLKRMKERGNSQYFIDKLEKNYENYIKESFEDDLCEEKIVLNKGEYLEDVFKRKNLI